MYIERLQLRNVRLLADETLSFVTGPGGSPRLWTAIVGDNGLCKSTILQSIALAALGPTLATAVAQDSQRFRDVAGDQPAVIQGTFRDKYGVFNSRLTVDPGRHDFGGGDPSLDDSPSLVNEPSPHAFPYDSYGEVALPSPQSGGSSDMAKRALLRRIRERSDPNAGTNFIADVRARREPGWFMVGYGVGRYLAGPGEVAPPRDPVVDRVRGLFDIRHRMLGLNFARALSRRPAARFVKALREVLRTSGAVGGELLPGFRTLHLDDAEGVLIRIGEREMYLPVGWLSDGHQAVIAWVADLLGHSLFERSVEGTPAAELEGVVLLDEIDLHLHPTWQRQIVSLLRLAFPRLQFIVTTHSPLVLGAFDRSEIIRLKLEGGRVTQDPAQIEPGILTASEVLTSYFSVAHAGRPDLVAKERRFLELRALTRPTTAQRAELAVLGDELDQYLMTVSGAAGGLRSPQDISKNS